jgi:phosphohistidine swiveling domain-containing protein
MEILTGREIRDFDIRGNYFNQRSLASRRALHSSKKQHVSNCPGYSPPVVEFELDDGARGSIVISDADIPALCNQDIDTAKRHLSLILNARQGDPDAVRQLSSADQEFSLRGLEPVQPSESRFVVPSTSCEAHSEQDISQKGFILLKLSQLGYPVPDFTVLTAQAYAERDTHLEKHLEEAIQQLEILTMQSLDDSKAPLVFAMRCATAHYIPGLLNTYLNVGVTESSLPCLEKMYGAVAAHKMFLNNLRNLCRCLGRDEYAAVAGSVRSDLPHAEVLRLTDRLCGIIGKTDRRLIEDPFHQAAYLARQAYKHFEENLELVLTLCRGAEHYPSLILQKMICTVRHDSAYVGVLNSRHTQTGSGIELQTARNLFGEEMMTGTAEFESSAFEDREVVKDEFPAVHHFIPLLGDLEREFESPVTIEFAVEATTRHQLFALLQLNQTGMAGRAAIISAVDMHKAGTISRQRVTQLIRPYHIKQLTSDTLDEEQFRALKFFCSGVSVLPQTAVSARVYFSSGGALTARGRGEKVCLCKKTFLPTDSAVMREMDAIISMTSAAIHVVTICQSLGIPALLSLEKSGVRLQPEGGMVNSDGKQIREGDWITISSRQGAIYEGAAKFKPGRLLRYIQGEPLDLAEDERKSFASIAYAFRYYQQLNRGIEFDQTSTLSEVIRLVNFELRGEPEQARQLVNGWFDNHETLYTEEVLKSDIGDHLGQSNVFEMLTLDRKIKFFQRALAKCGRDRISGYEAGAFMLGRFLSLRYPVAFWKALSPAEIGLLVNEWVLFEKYMQVLHNVGEQKVILARKQILMNGLEEISLHAGKLQWCLITLKLSGAPLQEAIDSLPAWSDPQSVNVLELLQQPYKVFYDFKACWSIRQLEKICKEENIHLPQPDDR